MKNKLWILITIIVIAILIVPNKKVCNDGGTIEYSAILYKVIKWNRIRPYEENKTGTEVYFFPKNLHSLDYYDDIRPEAIAVYNENSNEDDILTEDELVIANVGSYSWSKEVDGENLHIIADTIGPIEMEYKNALKTTKDGIIKSSGLKYDVVKIDTYKYNGDVAEKIENNLQYDKTNQEIKIVDMDKGDYIIVLYVENGEDDVWYSFKLEIQ